VVASDLGLSGDHRQTSGKWKRDIHNYAFNMEIGSEMLLILKEFTILRAFLNR